MDSHSKALLKLLESSSRGVSSLFLEGVVREVDVGIHPHEVGCPLYKSDAADDTS